MKCSNTPYDNDSRYWPPRINDQELVDAFPEMQQILSNLIPELVEKQKTLAIIIHNRLSDINRTYEDEGTRYLWVKWLNLNEVAVITDLNKQIARLKRQLRMAQGIPAPKGALTDDMIAAAKEVPIETIINGPFRKSGNKLCCLCPFHSEKTPSFFIYVETNTAYCFSCQGGGDSIDIVMRLNDCTFRKAIAILRGEL